MAAVSSQDLSWAPAPHRFAVHQWSGTVALATSRGLVLLDVAAPHSPKHVIQFQTHRETSVMRFHPSADSSLLATASENVLKVWNPLSPLRPAQLSAHSAFRILDVEWSMANPSVLVTVNAANQIEVWDVQSKSNPVQSFVPNHEAVAVYPNPHDDTLLCQGRTQLSLYEAKTLSAVRRIDLPSACFGASWDASGQHFLTVHEDGVARLWAMEDLSVAKASAVVPLLAKATQPEQSVRVILAGHVAWVCASRVEQTTNMVLLSYSEDGLAVDVLPQLTDEVIDIGLVRAGVQEGKATTVVAVSRAQKCYAAELMLGSAKRIHTVASARDLQAQASPRISTTLRFQVPKKSVRNLKKSLAPRDLGDRSSSSYNFAQGGSTNLAAANLWQEVLALDDLSRQHVLPGLTIEQFDEKARQVTFVMSLDAVQSVTAPDGGSKPPHPTTTADNIVSLIVVLPSHYPKRGLPTFNLRQGMGSMTISDDAPLPTPLMLTNANKNALNHALLEVCQNEMQKGLPYVKALGQAFHKWIVDFVYHSTNPASPSQAAATSSQFQRDQSVDAAESAIIEAVAYRVPCPRSCGARFSSSGALVQFGRNATGDAPGFMSPVLEPSPSSQHVPRKRTTYADYLLHMRENTTSESRSRAVSSVSSFMLPSPGDSPISSDQDDAEDDDNSDFVYDKHVAPSKSRDDGSGHLTSHFELYLDTPDVLLPISHPGHNFSLYDEDTPGRDDGLEVKQSGGLRSTAQLRLSSWAHVEVQVLVVDLSPLFRGQKQLAQVYSLGCMKPSSAVHRFSESKLCEMHSPKQRTPEPGAGLYTLVRTDGKDWRRRGILESKLEEMVAPAVVLPPVLSAEGDACRQNANAAARLQRPELARMWRTLATTFDAMYEDQKANIAAMPYHTPWRNGALGSKLINKTFAHLETCGELQTLAVLTCIMGGPKAAYDLLGPVRDMLVYDRILLSYAEVLMHWDALQPRAEVMKRVRLQPQAQSSQELALSVRITCQTCRRPTNGQWCGFCKDFAFRCAICATAVRGTSLFCLNCGHGGHPKHIEQWFVDHPECPTGCGCRCVEVSFAHSTDTDDDQTLETVLSNEDLQIVQAASDESLNRRASGKQVRFSAS